MKDEGRGINAQKLNRLFTRFDTLDEIDPNMSTGIGLSLVKRITESASWYCQSRQQTG